MPITRKVSAAVLAALTVLSASVPMSASAEEPAASAEGSRYVGTLTLITGDRVSVRRVGAKLVPVVEPAPGREQVPFHTSGTGDDLLVVPGDAWAALNSRTLDRRLFDVAALLRDGYGDADRGDLPLIVRSGSALTDTGATSTGDLTAVGGKALRQPKDQTADFWNALRDKKVLTSGTERVWLDGVRRPSLDVSVPQIGAPAAWQAGYTGTGVTVGVLDTGIDHTHGDLKDRVAARKDFTDDGDTQDRQGHGTHVASILAGTGAESNGKYRGVAPGATLLVGKVCGDRGCPESAILAGMEWAAAKGAKVVNLSLGGPDTSDVDPLEEAVAALSAKHGTLFVVAAGNDGSYGAETVGSPASADAALAVGSVDKQDVLSGSSSRGPRVHDAALKPEIVAPGENIMAARGKKSGLGDKKDRYTELSGTSMATPHVAGAAAILAQRHPDWTGHQLKAALMGSAAPIGDAGGYEQGAGRVDVARAVRQSVYAEPASVSAGRQSWPHEDDPLVTKTVGYRNTGTTPLTLALAATTAGPDGGAAPDGMFSLSASTVVIPAGGTASVQVTVNTALEAALGRFTAWIQAVGPDVRVVTPVVVDREAESYDLTLRTLDGAGRPTDANFTFLLGLDESRYRGVATVGGTGVVRVRKGGYHVDGVINTPRPDGKTVNSAKIVYPTVEVTSDRTVVLDSRQAKAVTVAFERPGVRARAVGVGYSRLRPDRAVFTGILSDSFERVFFGQVGDAVSEEELISDVGGVWLVPGPNDGPATVTYNLAWYGYGSVPNGITKTVVDRELAQIRTTYREQTNRRNGTKVWIAREPRRGVAGGYGFSFELPLTRTEFHNVDDLAWSAEFQQSLVKRKSTRTETVITGGVVDHRPGQSTVEEWNTAVFSPSLTGGDWAARHNDQLVLQVPMYGDAGLDRYGTSDMDAGSTVLYQGSTKVGETERAGYGQFDVPEAALPYRLETTATRSGVSEFSTRIACVWTFTSARPEPRAKGKGGVPLPLMVVRFTPPGLDDDNATKAPSALVPVTVQRPKGAAPATITGLAVQASYDDGRTWRPVAVTAGVATVPHPSGAKYVSFKATATDSLGGSVEQTVIRAYRI